MEQRQGDLDLLSRFEAVEVLAVSARVTGLRDGRMRSCCWMMGSPASGSRNFHTCRRYSPLSVAGTGAGVKAAGKRLPLMAGRWPVWYCPCSGCGFMHLALCTWLEGRFCRSTVEIRSHIASGFGLDYSHSGCIRLLARLGFEYRKPRSLPTGIGRTAGQPHRALRAPDDRVGRR